MRASEFLTEAEHKRLKNIITLFRAKEIVRRFDQEFPDKPVVFRHQYTVAMSRNERDSIMEKI